MGGAVAAPTCKSLTEVILDSLAYHLAIGMTADEFLNGDYELLPSYRKAFEIKQQIESNNAYMQGAYVYYAIAANAPILNAFSKARKPEQYLEQPFAISDEMKKQQEKAKAYENMIRMRNAVMQRAQQINKNRRKQGGEDNGSGRSRKDDND